jgi:hypothetical protein
MASTLRVRYPIGHIPDEVLKAPEALSTKQFPALIKPESFNIVFTKTLH